MQVFKYLNKITPFYRVLFFIRKSKWKDGLQEKNKKMYQNLLPTCYLRT